MYTECMYTEFNFKNCKVVNISEFMVSRLLNQILPEYPNACTCEKCISDIMAIALNSIKPNYVTSDVGAVYVKAKLEVDTQELASLTAIVIQAIEKVISNPRH